MAVTSRDVEYTADGFAMVGRLALPDGEGRRPGVLIAHEGPGLDDTQKSRAERFCVGAEDPFITVEERLAFEEEMRTAGVDWRMNLYGGVQHSFTHPRADLAGVPGIKYDQTTDERSWRAMLDLLDETFA